MRIFKLGIAIFVVASLLGGLATSSTILIAARVMQGVGAALAGPSVLALIMTMAKSDAERNKGMSLFIAVSSVGASAGLILGGALTELLSWRWSLLINVPIGALVLLFVGRLIAETPRKPATLDVTGALTATMGSVALVYGFISAADYGWLAMPTIISFALAVILIVAFFMIEKRTKDPLLDISLLASRSRLGGLAVMALIVGMHFSVLFLVVQYLQQVLGFAPLVAGAAYLPLTVTIFTITSFVPRLITRFGPRPLLVLGGILVAISLAGFAMLTTQSAYFPGVLVPLIIHAAGIALVFAPGTVAIMEGVPEHHAGTASGLLQMDQQIGGALGIAVIAAVYAGATVPGEFSAGLAQAFFLAAAIALIATVIAVFVIRPASAKP